MQSIPTLILTISQIQSYNPKIFKTLIHFFSSYAINRKQTVFSLRRLDNTQEIFIKKEDI